MFQSYREVIAEEPDLIQPARPVPAPPLRGIELEDVWFRYGPDQPWVVRGVSFVIPAGQLVALVGHNGAGKSTLVKLICRFYDPDKGRIRWDGIDLRDIETTELRDRVSVVFQDFMAYELSVADNIAVGDLSKAGNGRPGSAAAVAAAAIIVIVTAAPGSGLLSEAALAISAVLVAMLAAGVTAVIRRGTVARCPCFGSQSAEPLGVTQLIRNASLLALLLAGLACSPVDHARPTLAGSALAVMPGLVLALLFVRWDDLAVLLGPVRTYRAPR